MVEKGHTIRSVPYASPAHAPYGIEVMSLADLRAAGPRTRRTAPQRPQFHVLGVITDGIGHHTVDFHTHPLRPHTALWIRPGVVHRWDGVETLDGMLVLFRPDFLPPGGRAAKPAAPFGPVTWEIDPNARPRADLATRHLRLEYRDGAAEDPAGRAELLSHLLQALILRILPADQPPAPAGTAPTFPLLREAVETHFAAHREVAWYAGELGYAPRTLSRATHAATGRTAKQFIDDRVILEAKRLLAHADLPASTIARRLGFEDTNFTKFFRRHTRTTPGQFRITARGE